MTESNKTSLEGGPDETRNPDEEVDSSLTLKGGIALPSVGWAKGTTTFLGDVRGEFRKISWPTRRQVATETVVVLAVVALLTGLITLFDWIFAYVANHLLV